MPRPYNDRPALCKPRSLSSALWMPSVSPVHLVVICQPHFVNSHPPGKVLGSLPPIVVYKETPFIVCNNTETCYVCHAMQAGEIVTGLQSVPVYKLPLLLSAPRKFSWENAFLDFSMADHDTEAAAAVEAKEAAMAAASAETASGNLLDVLH